MTEHQLPTYEDLLWPTLKALETRGGSASIHELSEQVASDLSLPDEMLDTPHKDGPQSEIDYRAAWARTHLRYIGAVDNSSRGIWTITEEGRGLRTAEEIRERIRRVRVQRNKAQHVRSVDSEDGTDDASVGKNWT